MLLIERRSKHILRFQDFRPFLFLSLCLRKCSSGEKFFLSCSLVLLLSFNKNNHLYVCKVYLKLRPRWCKLLAYISCCVDFRISTLGNKPTPPLALLLPLLPAPPSPTPVLSVGPLMQRSPTFLAPGTGFVAAGVEASGEWG